MRAEKVSAWNSGAISVIPSSEPRSSPTDAFQEEVTKARKHCGSVDGIQVRLRHRIEDENPRHVAVAELRKLQDENQKLLWILYNLEDELTKK